MNRTVEEPWEYFLSLPHSPLAPGVARSALRAILTKHSLLALADTAELLAGELCTNAFQHTRAHAALRVHWRGHTLRISVWDTSAAPPRPMTAASHDERGRGLLLVSTCATTWGSYPMTGGRGKVTWFELAG